MSDEICKDECCKVAREMYWSEIDDTEKIRRMRSEIKNLQRKVKKLNKLFDRLSIHSHLSNGEIVIPLHSNMENDEIRLFISNEDEQYF